VEIVTYNTAFAEINYSYSQLPLITKEEELHITNDL